MSAIYIPEDAASSLLTMKEALEITESVFASYGEGRAFGLPRQRMRIRKGALHLLSGALPDKGVIGYKAYTSFKAGLSFKTYLHDSETGNLLAVVDSNEIGRLRTGAASGVAIKYLARKNSETAFIFGAGFQAEAQAEAAALTAPLKKIYCSSKTLDNTEVFAMKMTEKLGIPVEIASNMQHNVGEADIIVTITSASTPLFDAKWITKKGVHINAAGSNALIRAEIPEKTVEAADLVVVDSREVCALECGDVLASTEKGRLHWNQIAELGDVVAGFRPGRTSDDQLTLFESQGMGVLDVACAEYVYRKAADRAMGIPLPF